jgi:hypothetical protein
MSSDSSSESDSMESQIKGKKFSWPAHLQTLKDVVSKLKLYNPNADQFRELATILSKTYKIEGVDAEKVRTKFRSKTFKKWLETQTKKNQNNMSVQPPKKKRKRSEEAYDDDEDDDDEDESGEGGSCSNEVVPFQDVPPESMLETQPWNCREFHVFPAAFKMYQPTVLASSTNYYVLYRTDLGTQVIPHVKVTPVPLLLLEIKIDPIYADEMSMTQAWKDPEISMPRLSSLSKCVPVPLPSDALLGSSSVTRNDYDSEYGRLFEFVIPKFRNSVYSVGPPKHQLKQQEKAETTKPLHKQNETPPN